MKPNLEILIPIIIIPITCIFLGKRFMKPYNEFVTKQHNLGIFSILDCECGQISLILRFFRKNRTSRCTWCNARYNIQ